MIPPFDRADDGRRATFDTSNSYDRLHTRTEPNSSTGGRTHVGGRADFLDGPLVPEPVRSRIEALREAPRATAPTATRAAAPKMTPTASAADSAAVVGGGRGPAKGGRGAGRVLLSLTSEDLRAAVAAELRRDGRGVEFAGAHDVLATAMRETFELCVFEVNDPSDAIAIDRVARECPAMRRIVLASGGEEARVVALERGADDALSVPCSAREVLARANAQLRRLDLSTGTRIHVEEGLVVDLARLEIERAGRTFDLTPLEAGILGYVVRHGHRVVGRDEILEAVWSDPTTRACARTVDVHIVALRRKLHGNSGSQRLIRTVRGHGYRWCGRSGLTEG
jgi:DNA-binding response OmpR family regulator